VGTRKCRLLRKLRVVWRTSVWRVSLGPWPRGAKWCNRYKGSNSVFEARSRTWQYGQQICPQQNCWPHSPPHTAPCTLYVCKSLSEYRGDGLSPIAGMQAIAEDIARSCPPMLHLGLFSKMLLQWTLSSFHPLTPTSSMYYSLNWCAWCCTRASS
jgi:hypothetical protein